MMRIVSVLLTGMVFGAAIQSGPVPRGRIVALNHVGLNVEHFDDALNFYTKTLGFQQVYSRNGPDGKQVSAFLQISRNSFIEITQVSANQAAGVTHFGVQVDDMDLALAQFKKNGINVGDVRKGSTATKVGSATDPWGVRLELLETGPESLQGKAMESWR